MTSTALSAGEQRASAPDRQRPVRRRAGRGRPLTFWLFVGPFVVGMAIFVYAPIVWGLVLSFFEAQNTVTPTEFVGVRNYADMLGDPAFRESLVTFSIFAAFIVPVTTAIALGLAMLLHRIRFLQGFFRSVLFLPAACSYVVACLIWKLSIFNGVRFGLANTVLSLFDIENVNWLGTVDPPLYWLVLVTVRLWLQLGFYTILFLAGLQRINTEMYEAAYVDGAKPGWQIFRNITLPSLRATTVAVVLLNIIAAFQAFDEFYNLMGIKSPLVRPPLMYLYTTALGAEQDFGRGTAGAFILSALIIVVTLVQSRITRFSRDES
jgi:multiple sugar transport system permease protein